MTVATLHADPAMILAAAAELRAGLEPPHEVTDAEWEAFWSLPDATGFVYFIQQGKDGPIKIGFTANLEERQQALQIGNPEPLRLRLALPARPQDERRYRRDFDFAHLRGEWFTPCSDLLDFIRGLT